MKLAAEIAVSRCSSIPSEFQLKLKLAWNVKPKEEFQVSTQFQCLGTLYLNNNERETCKFQ